jgi:hypothetical protein
MNEFLHQGKHQSIPVFVFYTRSQRYLAHWTERPALANEQMHLVNAIFQGKTAEEALPEYDRFQQGEVWANWRQETVVREPFGARWCPQQRQPASSHQSRCSHRPGPGAVTLRALLLSARVERRLLWA